MRLFFILILASFLISCSESNSPEDKECKLSCKNWEKCDDGSCVLKENYCNDKSDCKAENKKCIAHSCYDEDYCDENVLCSDNNKCFQNKCYNKNYCDKKISCDSNNYVCKENICLEKIEEVGKYCIDNIDNDFNGFKDCQDDKCKNTTYCDKCKDKKCDIGFSCNPENGECVSDEVKTIKEIKEEKSTDKTYNTKATVTAVDKDGFFMQDSSERGIYVYVNKKYIEQKIGDLVYVSGKYKLYYDFSELYDVKVSTITFNQDLPEFKEIDAANIENLKDYESMLVRFKNAPFLVEEINSDPNNFDSKVKDSNNKSFKIRNNIYAFNLVLEDEITLLQGVLTYHREEFKLIPRNENDITIKKPECSPACNQLYEKCVKVQNEENQCKLKENMCDNESDGCSEDRMCENNHCVLIEKNILINGDFEEDYNTDPDPHGWVNSEEAKGWIFEYNNLAKTVTKRTRTTEQYPNEFVHSGEFSSKITKKQKETTGDRKPEYQSPKIFIDTNKEYNISMFLYDNDPNVSARVFLRFFHEEGDTLYSIKAINSGGGSANKTIDKPYWKEYKYPFNWSIYAGLTEEEKSKITYMRVGVRLFHQTSDEGYIYIDDVRVEEREEH